MRKYILVRLIVGVCVFNRFRSNYFSGWIGVYFLTILYYEFKATNIAISTQRHLGFLIIVAR